MTRSPSFPRLQLGLNSGALFLSSVGGLAISLASKDILENFIAGLIIVNKGHCQVGEVVSVGNGASGQVLRIGWLMTDFRHYDKLTLLHIPNSTIVKSGIEVLTFNTHRKVKQVFTIPYEAADKVQSILREIRQAFFHIPNLETFRNVAQVRSPFHKPRCFVSEMSPSGLVITVAYLVGPVRTRGTRGGSMEAAARTEMALAICKILAAHGVSISAQAVRVYNEGTGQPNAFLSHGQPIDAIHEELSQGKKSDNDGTGYGDMGRGLVFNSH